MAEATLADNILNKIQTESEDHNKRLGDLIGLTVQVHKDNLKLRADDERAQKIATKYAAEQQGQEVYYSKEQQHQQHKTVEELSLQQGKDIKAEREAALKVEKDKARDMDNRETLAQRRDRLLKELKEKMTEGVGRTVDGWRQDAAARMKEWGDFSKFQSTVKADMSLFMGKLQMLTQLPGVTTLLQAIKFVLGTIATYLLSTGPLNKIMNPLFEKFEDMMVALGMRSSASVKDARKIRAELADPTVKSAKGDEYMADSPQGKMITNMQRSADTFANRTRDGFNEMSEKVTTGFKDMGDWMKSVIVKQWTRQGFDKQWEAVTEQMSELGAKLKGFFEPMMTKGMGVFSKAMGWMHKQLILASKTIMKLAKRMFAAVAKFAFSVGLWLAAKLAAIASFLAIPLLIAAIVLAVIFIGMYIVQKIREWASKFEEEWEVIKMKWENFSFSEWFDNIFTKFVLSVKNLWWTIASGIENFINSAIEWYNSKMPGSAFDIDWRADFGAGAKLDEISTQRTAIEAKENQRAEDMATHEKGIRDHYAAERTGKGITDSKTVQQNNVSNTNRSDKNIVSGTQPVDAFAAAMNSPTF